MRTRAQLGHVEQRPDLAETIDPTAIVYSTAIIAPSVTELRMGPATFIGDFVLVSVPHLIMFARSQVNSGARLVGKSAIGIGQDSVVGYGSTLLTSSDTTKASLMNDASPLDKRIIRDAPIDIGPRVFIGAHSIIMPGVDIAPGVVVRAFSYVDKPLMSPNGIYGGQPARLLGFRKIAQPPVSQSKMA